MLIIDTLYCIPSKSITLLSVTTTLNKLKLNPPKLLVCFITSIHYQLLFVIKTISCVYIGSFCLPTMCLCHLTAWEKCSIRFWDACLIDAQVGGKALTVSGRSKLLTLHLYWLLYWVWLWLRLTGSNLLLEQEKEIGRLSSERVWW